MSNGLLIAFDFSAAAVILLVAQFVIPKLSDLNYRIFRPFLGEKIAQFLGNEFIGRLFCFIGAVSFAIRGLFRILGMDGPSFLRLG
jgi:hypothetical protein